MKVLILCSVSECRGCNFCSMVVIRLVPRVPGLRRIGSKKKVKVGVKIMMTT